MDNRTPTARLTLDAIRDGGPGNVHELRERTGRSRSATDKAIAELANANLIVKVDDGGDPADGAPTRWQLANPAADGDAGQPDTPGDDSPAEPTADQPATTGAEATDPASPGGSDTAPAGAGPTDQAPPVAVADAAAGAERADQTPAPDGDADPAAEAQAPKLCRGCQAQMPTICQDCWQKTPAYCGTCRRDMPQVRRGEPGEPAILSNGLPKLRPGELEELVATVLREHPVPHHVGVTGWTSGRVAVYLPGRSTGAIGNALRKMTKTGVAELIGDNPERYQLTGANATDADPNAARDASQPEAGQPAADGAAKAAAPQADTTTA